MFENGKSRKGIKNDYGHGTFELFWKEKADLCLKK